jgi:hypothetical protein
MSDISKHIINFLHLSGELIIPGFGKVHRTYHSAELDRANFKISAPYYRIYFDFSVQEDEQDELLNYIAKVENISFEDAAEALQTYKKSILERIFNGEKVEVVGIGSFSLVSDSIQFEPDTKVGNDESLDAVPVKREVKLATQTSKKKNKRSIFFVRGRIFLILSIILILTITFYLKPFKSSKVKDEKAKVEKNTSEKQQVIKTDSLQKEIADSTPVISKEEPNNTEKEYIIVVGTYAGLKNAQIIEKQLKADGYKPLMKKYNNGKIRVAVSFRGEISALNDILKRIRIKYDKAAFLES